MRENSYIKRLRTKVMIEINIVMIEVELLLNKLHMSIIVSCFPEFDSNILFIVYADAIDFFLLLFGVCLHDSLSLSTFFLVLVVFTNCKYTSLNTVLLNVILTEKKMEGKREEKKDIN